MMWYSGGRVIDPETKLDAIKNVGIINNRIAQISSETLQGKEIVNVTFSQGIEYVMVNGSFVLRNGKTINNIFPGQAVYGKIKK